MIQRSSSQPRLLQLAVTAVFSRIRIGSIALAVPAAAAAIDYSRLALIHRAAVIWLGRQAAMSCPGDDDAWRGRTRSSWSSFGL